MTEYDFLFVQNAPAFYKINLFNALSANYRIGVIFLGESEQVVSDKNPMRWKFDAYYLNKNNIDKKRNCIISESSIYESTTTGINGFLKRLILNRSSHAFVSGLPHKDLLSHLRYRGAIHITGGVGLALRNHKPIQNAGCRKKHPLRYVYTGRIIELKNLKLLIKTFNENCKQLTIIGTGCKETEYKAMAKSNITFLGFIDNSKLKEIYANCDCLILPSYSEVWGLVVEEALYNGLPVIVSDMVGCNVDMVKNYDSGIVFNHQSIDSLQNAIEQMEQNYRYYKNNVMAIDWEKRDKKQIEAFADILQA